MGYQQLQSITMRTSGASVSPKKRMCHECLLFSTASKERETKSCFPQGTNGKLQKDLSSYKLSLPNQKILHPRKHGKYENFLLQCRVARALCFIYFSSLTSKIFHRIVEWHGGYQAPARCGQDCHLLDQTVQSHIQPGLKPLQGWSINNFFGQPVSVLHHTLSEEFLPNI